MSFEKEWKKALSDIDKAIDKTMRSTALQLFAVIIKRTPVGNPSLWQNDPPAGYVGGSLRANWQATINAPASGVVSSTDGAAALNSARSVTARYKVGDDMYLTNNLPYAQRVEDGWSQQRPQGMVRVSVMDFNKQLEKAARANRI